MDVKSLVANVELKDTPEGTFTARVATLGKVDKAGDVLKAGAFRDTIQRWRASGGVVPVVFSHGFHDPLNFIGEVQPTDLQETANGLVAHGSLYLHEANGRKVYDLLRRRALREWSFAFHVTSAKPLAAGARELLSVDLLELGPTLAGVGDTATLAVKSEARCRRVIVGTTRADLAPLYARLDIAQRRVATELALARGR